MRSWIFLLTMIMVLVAESSFSVASGRAVCTPCHNPFQQEESRVSLLKREIERRKERGADTGDAERRLASVATRLRALYDEHDAVRLQQQAAGVDAELAGLEKVMERSYGAKGLAPLTVWGSLVAALLLRLLIRHYDRTDP